LRLAVGLEQAEIQPFIAPAVTSGEACFTSSFGSASTCSAPELTSAAVKPEPWPAA
jgi:hypothetical protein